jgi:predicted Zn-dependent peptidase
LPFVLPSFLRRIAPTSAPARAEHPLSVYVRCLPVALFIEQTANPEAKTASLTLVLKAGSRYEPAPGVASVLKNFAFKVRHPSFWDVLLVHDSAKGRRNGREEEIRFGWIVIGPI